MGGKVLVGLQASMTQLVCFFKRAVKFILSRIRDTPIPKPNPASDFPAAWAVHRGKSFSEWNGLRFEIIHSMDGLLKLADGWRQLTQGLRPARHYHHVEWFLALTRTMDQFGDGSYLYVAIYDSLKLVGIVPLRVTTAWVHGVPYPVPVKALRLLSNVRETPATRDVIFAESVIDADVFTGLVRYLDKLNSWWDVIALTDVIEGSHAHAAFLKTPTLPSLTTFGRACGGHIDSISCGPSDMPFQRLSPKFRRQLRNAHNRLAAEGPRFLYASTPEELREAYPKLVAVEASGWKHNSEYCIANHPQFDAFLRHLMFYFEPIGGYEIHLLQLADCTIAGLLCIVSARINFMHVVGYDETYSRLSPGFMLLENLITTQAQKGEVDFITSGHAASWFSSHWKPDHILTVSDHYLFRPSKRDAKIRDRLAKKATAQLGEIAGRRRRGDRS